MMNAAPEFAYTIDFSQQNRLLKVTVARQKDVEVGTTLNNFYGEYRDRLLAAGKLVGANHVAFECQHLSYPPIGVELVNVYAILQTIVAIESIPTSS